MFRLGYEDNEGNVGTTGKKQKKQKKNKRQQRTIQDSGAQNSNEDIVLYNSSSVADKEVFTSGEFYFDK